MSMPTCGATPENAEILAAAAVAKAERQAAWNLAWRFSPTRAGLWREIMLIGATAIACWVLGRTERLSFAEMLYVLLFQVVICRSLGELHNASRQLFSTGWQSRFHQSPTVGSTMFIGLMYSGLASSVRSCLLCGVVLTVGWPWPGRIGIVLIATVSGSALCVATDTVARSFLVLVARWRSGAVGKLAAGLLFLYAGAVVALSTMLVRGQWHVVVNLAIQLKLLLVAWTVVVVVVFVIVMMHQDTLGRAYREAWLDVSEGWSDNRRRQRWYPSSAFGHVVGIKDWATGLRNPLTWVRITVGLGGAITMSIVNARLATFREPWLTLGVAVLLWMFMWVEWLATTFRREQHSLTLYLQTPRRADWLLIGKLLAQWPVVAGGTLFGFIIALSSFRIGVALTVAFYSWLLTTGITVALVSFTAVEVKQLALAASMSGESVHESMLEELLWEQVPQGLVAWMAITVTVAYTLTAWWLLGHSHWMWSASIILAMPAFAYWCGKLAIEKWRANP